jgi:hypothetical protein
MGDRDARAIFQRSKVKGEGQRAWDIRDPQIRTR